ncbi:Glyoxalase/bleomycin resistance protein/dioxygenase [Thozetella sp. PMI_491]|nr:Glyoxalase/bleomycin resistance protein/dioxygenase [Thozetella sp. PMI_491]
MDPKNPLQKISAISLFVEDLPAAKAFYQSVFGVSVLFEDPTSVAVKFENLIVNLLLASEGSTLVHPATVGGPDSGKRFQISIWVDDLDGVCAKLAAENVTLLTGPQLQPWGMKTVTFVDPAGHSWEVGQQVK